MSWYSILSNIKDAMCSSGQGSECCVFSLSSCPCAQQFVGGMGGAQNIFIDTVNRKTPKVPLQLCQWLWPFAIIITVMPAASPQLGACVFLVLRCTDSSPGVGTLGHSVKSFCPVVCRSDLIYASFSNWNLLFPTHPFLFWPQERGQESIQITAELETNHTGVPRTEAWDQLGNAAVCATSASLRTSI